jgi:spore germination protein YaaH
VAFASYISLTESTPLVVVNQAFKQLKTTILETDGEAAIVVGPEQQKNADLAIFGAIPYWDQARATAVFKKYVDYYDAISLFWYRLTDTGRIVPYASAKEDLSIVEFAHQHGIKVFGLIANLPENGEWDNERVQLVIGTREARAAHIADLLVLAKAKNFDGINIDYEFLDDEQTEAFTAFINELGAALHKEGKLLRVALHAQRRGSETRGQDIASLTGADYLSIMMYDQHWETSDPGPLASIRWAREVLEHLRQLGVPMHKVLMGIPLDAYDWVHIDDGEWGEAVGLQYADVVRIANTYDVEVKFSEREQAPYFNYYKGDAYHEVWFENVKSFEPKFRLAQEFGLGGVGLWRMGREDKRIYDFLATIKEE